jgi:hypothetical protein
MKCLWLTMLLPLIMAGGLLAQEPVITPQTPVDDGVLHQWLHSGDPRLIAWAATFARRTLNVKIIEAQREKLHATVEALRQKGLLSEGEAAMVVPRLFVTVQCEIQPCPLN